MVRKVMFSAAAAVVLGGSVAGGAVFVWKSFHRPAPDNPMIEQSSVAQKDESIFAQDSARPAELAAVPDKVAPPAAVRSTLLPGETLVADQQLSSSNGLYRVVMNGDGNLVEVNADNETIWSTQTHYSGSTLIFQPDGNLVVYTADRRTALWASGTAGGRAAAKLVLQDDGNMVLTSASGRALWGSMQDKTILFTGQVLRGGQSRTSVNGEYTLIQQTDGNLVVYQNATHTVLWSSQTGAHSGAYTVLAGSLVTFSRDGDQLFTTGPMTNDDNTVFMQDDGNLVLLRPDNTTVWGSLSHGVSLLVPGQSMTPGQWRTSTEGRYRLDMQLEGNLVFYDEGQNHKVLWESHTGGNPGAFVRLQTDGNLVILAPGGTVLWQSATGGRAVEFLGAQGDGNLVLYGPGHQPIWWSRR